MKITKQKDNKKYSGAIALMTIILVMAILVSVTVSTLLLTIDLGESGLGLRSNTLAEMMHYNCLEESMNILKEDISYVGSVALGDTDLGCDADVASLGGGQSTVDISGYASGYTYERSVTVDLTVFPIEIVD